MKKIGKILSGRKTKILSIIFTFVTIICLTTTLILSMTYTKGDDNKGDSNNLSQTKEYYEQLSSSSSLSNYLIYQYYNANEAPDGITEGYWVIGINYGQLHTDLTNGTLNFTPTNTYTQGEPLIQQYVSENPAIVIPERYDGKNIVGVNFTSTNTLTSYSNYIGLNSFIEYVKIPKTVKYITKASFYNFSKLGYFETPFIGTERGSSARGLNKNDLDLEDLKNKYGTSSDSFGSMFSEPSPYNQSQNFSPQSGWDSHGGDYEPRAVRWGESENTTNYWYFLPSKIDYLIITDETSLGNYALSKSSARIVEITASSETDLFEFGYYCFAESGLIATADSSGNNVQGEQGLEEIKLNMANKIKFNTGTFNYCQTLKNLIIPNFSANPTIPASFAYRALSLESVYIPGTVKEIGNGAFNGCNKLKRIATYNETIDYSKVTFDYETDKSNGLVNNSSYMYDLPTGLEIIGNDAFKECSELDTIFVPDSVTSIGWGAYAACSKVEKVILPFIGSHRSDCILSGDHACIDVGDNGKTEYHKLFGWIFGGSNVSGDNFYLASQGNSGRFYIPKKLTEITITSESRLAKGCLQNLENVTSIVIGERTNKEGVVEENDRLKGIEEGCMNGCSNLISLSIPSIKNNLGFLFAGNEFSGSYGTTGTYKVPNTLKMIKINNMPQVTSGLFTNCTSLETVEISKNTVYMDESIFYNNSKLKTLIIPFVGAHRGYYSTYDKYHGGGWIHGSHVNLRSSLKWIFSRSDHSDTYCNGWTSHNMYYHAYIPNSLENLTITDDTDITWQGVRGFSSLKNILITNVPTSVGEGAFAGCSDLEAIQIPYTGHVKQWNNIQPKTYHQFGWIFGAGSYGNSYEAAGWYIPKNLKTVEVGSQNTAIENLSNTIYYSAFNGCSSIETIDFKNANIVELQSYAFANCKNLTTIKYPNAQFKHVGDYAFYNCLNIKTLKKIGNLAGSIPDTVVTLGDYAFSGTSVGYKDSNNYRDNKVDLKGYTSLGAYAFSNCLQIDEITVPEGVSVGEGLFADCLYLNKCILPSQKKDVSAYMFKNCISLTALDLRGISDLPEGILYGCTNMKFDSKDANKENQLQLNQYVNSIGPYAFKGCVSFKDFVFPSIQSDIKLTIGEGAFQGCTGLEYMTIPAETKAIDKKGFIGCDDNFYFWVYYPEDEWPKDWVTNWNCDYPVYVIGDKGVDIFTYTYDVKEKKYYITGITEQAYKIGLSGQIRIPSSHNGIAVVGIDEKKFNNDDKTNPVQYHIYSQTGITSIILPKGLTKISKDNDGNYPFQTGYRVDIYTEYTKEEIKKIYNDSFDLKKQEYADWENGLNSIDDEQVAAKQNELMDELKGWLPLEANEYGEYIYLEDEKDWDNNIYIDRRWVDKGVLYYANDWSYGGLSKTIPYINVNSIKFTFDEVELGRATYNGSEIEVPIVKAQLPGEVFISDDFDVDKAIYIYDDNINIFNFTYYDNIVVGNAKVKIDINTDVLENYNKAIENEKYPLRLFGTKTLTYKIKPVELIINSAEDDGKYVKTYDRKEWSNNVWILNQIKGLDGFPGATFKGTLRTTSANAGIYLPLSLRWDSYSILINGIDITSNFTVKILFEVHILPQEVEIVFLEEENKVGGNYVLAELWGDQSNAAANHKIYSYRYIGQEITPYAIAKVYKDDPNANAEYISRDYCPVKVVHISNKGLFPYEESKSTYHFYAYLADNSNYKLCKRLDDGSKQEKPELILSTNNKIIAIDDYYRIAKGRIIINIDLSEPGYTIGIFEDNWSISWGLDGQHSNSYITGLGENSNFVGKLASSYDAKTSYTYNSINDDIIVNGKKVFLFNVSYSETDPKISWQEVSYKEEGYVQGFTATAEKPYLIYNRYLAGQNQGCDDTNRYDVIVNARVKIIYNDFDVSYYIGEDTNDYETLKIQNYQQYPTLKDREYIDASGNKDNRIFAYMEYAVDRKTYRFSMEDLALFNKVNGSYTAAEIEKLGYVKTYYSDKGTSSSSDEPTFINVGTYLYFVNFTARHYNDKQFNVWVEAVKSDVKLDNLSKYYDRKPVDLKYIQEKFLKIDSIGQLDNITLVFKDSTGNIILDEPPVNVGKYKVHITIPGTDFFNEYDKEIDFEIKKRIITLNVSTPSSSMLFNNNKYVIDLSKRTDLGIDSQGPNGGLLDGDSITGTLQTTDFIPEKYYTEVGYSYGFEWKYNYEVKYLASNNYVTENYDVVLKGTFDILPLQFEYEVKENPSNSLFDQKTNSAGIPIKNEYVKQVDYDGKFHSLLINVLYPSSTNYSPAPTSDYNVYYSDINLSEFSNGWSNSSYPYSQPGKYDIYFMIKADYFETIIGHALLEIKALKIIYTESSTNDSDNDPNIWTFEYDGLLKEYEINVTTPSDNSHTILYDIGDGLGYTLVVPSYQEEGVYTLRYKIMAPNYETVERTVKIHILPPSNPLPDGVYNCNYFDGIYDGEYHNVEAKFNETWVNSQKNNDDNFWTKITYSTDEGKTWTEVNPKYKEIGEYGVWVKFSAKGYSPKIEKGKIKIKGKTLYLVSSDFVTIFDNKYHNIGLDVSNEGKALGYELKYDEEKNEYTLIRKEAGVVKESVVLDVYYTTNGNDKFNDQNWLQGRGYKDVGLYAIYMKIEAENYEPLIVTDSNEPFYNELEIKFLSDPDVSAKTPQIFEYRKSPLTAEDIIIDSTIYKYDKDGNRILPGEFIEGYCVADGAKTAYWYSATKIGDTYSKDVPEQRIDAPQELGVYYVKIRISASKNTGACEVECYVEIVPKVLEVKFDSPQYYDGSIKDPNPYVETGTSDIINLGYKVQGNADPIDIGKYTFDVWKITNNPNYVLKENTFIFEIIKRSVLFKLDETMEKTENNDKWDHTKSIYYDNSNQTFGEDHWAGLGQLSGEAEKYLNGKLEKVTYTGLASNHMILVELETMYGVRATYYYSTISSAYYSNRVVIKGPTYNGITKAMIVEKDNNGNIVRDSNGNPIDVTEFYDIDFDIKVSIVNPEFNVDLLEFTNEYVYDGLYHQLIINNLSVLGNSVLVEFFNEDFDNGTGKPKGKWVSACPKKITVGNYKIKYRISAMGYETTEGEKDLIIKPADLIINISDDMYKTRTNKSISLYAITSTSSIHNLYDGTPHLNFVEIPNILAGDITPTHIRYFAKDLTINNKTITEADIRELYDNAPTTLDITESKLYKAGLDAVVDAGKYYCVVYFEEDINRWHRNYSIKEVQLKPRDIVIDINQTIVSLNINNNIIKKTYDGTPIIFNLVDAVIDNKHPSDFPDGLLQNHDIDASSTKLLTYSVRTNSANAKIYDLETDFEFEYIEIRDNSNSGKLVKMSNYHPVLKGNLIVEITKKYLEDDEFNIIFNNLNYFEYIKEYNGKIHSPHEFGKDAKTDKDKYFICLSDGQLTLIFYEFLSYENNLDGPRLNGDQKDVGKYHVYFEIGEGTNYYSSEDSYDNFKADGTRWLSSRFLDYYVTCNPKKVNVIWDEDKIKQTFNGEILSPDPYFIDNETDPNNEIKVYLATKYQINNFEIKEGQINTGSYYVNACFDTTTPTGIIYNKNYELQNTNNYFLIEKLKLTIQIGDGGDSNDIVYYSTSSAWNVNLYKQDTPGGPEIITNGDKEIEAFLKRITTFENVRIMTIGSTERLYSGKGDFKVTANAIKIGDLDIQKSLEFDILGSVQIVADRIVYEYLDEISVEYRGTGYSFEELNILTVTNPKEYSLENFKINGNITTSKDIETMVDVGDYEISFDIKADNKTSISLKNIVVHIVKAKSFFIPIDSLNKVYDGAAVKGSEVAENAKYAFNGEVSNLKYTYYKIVNGREELLGDTDNDAPYQAGQYAMYITQTDDTNPNVHKNYTDLNQKITFTISKRTINLVIKNDMEIETDVNLGQKFDSGEIIKTGGDNKDELITLNNLYYSYTLADLQRGNYFAKKVFKESNNGNYQEFVTDNGTTFMFSWQIFKMDPENPSQILYETITLPDPANPSQTITDQRPIDLSSNYEINLTFDMSVHYPYIPVEINGYEGVYDKNPHTGTITYSDSTKKYTDDSGNVWFDKEWFENNTLTYFSLNTIDESNLGQANTLDDVKQTEPGKYNIYYLIKVDTNKQGNSNIKFEYKKGTIVINIKKIDREIIITDPTKIYDGNPIGKIYTGFDSIGRYFPIHEFDYKDPSIIDQFDYKDVKITYYRGSFEIDPKTGCIESGNYYYTMSFPESEYYNELIVPRTYFYINRVTIYIENNLTIGSEVIGYSSVFNNLVVTYEFDVDSNFNQLPSSHYKLYTLDNNGTEQPLTDFSLITTLVTNSSAIGEYIGSKLKPFGYQFTVVNTIGEDITNNYQIDYSKASITITPGEIVATAVDNEFIYDGLEHGFTYQISTPSPTICNVFYKDKNTGNWVNVMPKYRDVGDYTVDIKIESHNYETKELTLKLKINRAPTIFKYVTSLNKTYDGEEVGLPEQVETNRDDANENNQKDSYIYEYYEYDKDGALIANPMFTVQMVLNSKGELVLQTTGTRPVNAGKYMIKIIVPESKNFEANTYTSDFYISKLKTSISWDKLNFIYNGEVQKPVAKVNLTTNDEEHKINIVLKYTIVAGRDPYDNRSILAGDYEITAEIDYDNSDAKAINYEIADIYKSKTYTIQHREITITFSKENLLDNSPNHLYFIQHISSSLNTDPSTTLKFDATNIVNGHVINDFLKLNYDTSNPYKKYNTLNDFTWCDAANNAGNVTINYPRIVDSNNQDVTNNYKVKYNLSLSLTNIQGKPSYQLVGYKGNYDGNDHTFTLTLDKPSDYKVAYKWTGTTSFTFEDDIQTPSKKPEFKNVGVYNIEIKFYSLAGDEVHTDNTTVQIDKASPKLTPNIDMKLGKIYDGKPVDDPEMDYEGKSSNDKGKLKYTYYEYVAADNGYTKELTSAPKNVGKYKVNVSYIEDDNYAAEDYTLSNLVFEIQARKITITIKQSKGIKLYDGLFWKSEIDNSDVVGSGVDGLAPDETIQWQQQILELQNANVGKYNPNTNRNLLSWNTTGQTDKCKIWNKENEETQDNYVFEYTGEIEIKKRTFAYEFKSCIKTDDGLPGYAVLNIKGVYEADGSINTNFGISSSTVKIYYYLDIVNGNKTPYTENTIPVTTVGQPVIVYADIVDISGNIESLYKLSSFVLILNNAATEDPDLTDGPDDALNDPDNISFEGKNKVYDGELYEEPKYIGSDAANRNITVSYYTLAYYKECMSNNTPLDPSKKISRPRDVDDYVFILTASAYGSTPEQSWAQAFRIKRRYVDIDWKDYYIKLPSGKNSLDYFALPKASFKNVFGQPVDLVVSPQSGYKDVGTYPVTADFYTEAQDTTPTKSNARDQYNQLYSRNYALKINAKSFQITKDGGINPKPSDAETNPDINFIAKKEYDGNQYPAPTYTGTGTPTIVYYTWDYWDKNYPNLDPSQGSLTPPINANEYVFVLTIPAHDGKAEQVYHQAFEITPKEVEAVWGNLDFMYNGQHQGPTPTFTDINGNQINCTINPAGYTNVGQNYPLTASSPDSNYKIKNFSAKMNINGTDITAISILPDQIYTYLDMIILAATHNDDTNDIYYYVYKDEFTADPSYGFMNNPLCIYDKTCSDTITTYDKVFADLSKVFVVDDKGIIYNINSNDKSLTNANRPYKMILDNDKSAKEHKVELQLTDKVQTTWKDTKDTKDKEIGKYLIKAFDLNISSTDPEWEINYKIDEDTWLYTGKPIEPKLTITLKNKKTNVITTLVGKSDTVSKYDFELTYKNNINVTTDTSKAEIYVTGTGNYDFTNATRPTNPNGALPINFNINDSIELLELIDGSIAKWITAKITNEASGILEVKGLDADENGVVANIKHTDVHDSKNNSMYLGGLRQELFIETVLKQFKNYDDHPEMFVVKRPAKDYEIDDFNGPNNYKLNIEDGYIILDPNNIDFKKTYFGNGYKVSLVKTQDGKVKTLDEMTAIIFGDINCDGVVNVGDTAESVQFTKTLDRTTIKDYQYISGVISRTNCIGVYNVGTTSFLVTYTKNTNDTNNDFNYFNGAWNQIQSSS